MAYVASHRGAGIQAGVGVVASIKNVANSVVTYFERRQTEKRLRSLDDRMLTDIGITRGDIHAYVWNR